MKKLISLFTLLFICFILFSCASGTSFVTGKKRPYVNPDRISIYTEPPEDYEVIGIVSASSDSGFTDQGSLNYAIAELKKQAGKIGANGIILESISKSNSGGSFVGNVFVADSAQNVTGKAIYVLK
ncbi:hypothetical protein [uncultured Treponema sp.]|uniref:hypothetical protein n=1 Tax=uncultured Treponema sp. TaxID=162155 RepID=UPI0025F5445E|nr:hypothetical protein [uncultured Treponema sp.]